MEGLTIEQIDKKIAEIKKTNEDTLNEMTDKYGRMARIDALILVANNTRLRIYEDMKILTK
jgi:prefoldin subunit 5